MFWVDLSAAGLIDGGFNIATPTTAGLTFGNSSTDFGDYMPAAKIGGGNYVTVWSGGWTNSIYTSATQANDGNNYYTISRMVTGYACADGLVGSQRPPAKPEVWNATLEPPKAV